MNKDTKVSAKRQKKEVVVAEIAEKANRAKAFVFANYQGMTHKQIEGFKKALKTANADLVVTKNTLLKLALQSTGYSLQATAVDGSPKAVDSLDGPTATIFAYDDIVTPLKELAKIIKLLKLPVVKFGIVEGKTISSDDVIKLSSLPTKEVLLAQLVGGLKSPIFGLHRALNWNMQKLVMTLKAIEEKKPAAS